MVVPILAPFRPAAADRTRLWGFCRQWWADQLGWPIIEGDHEGDPYNRSKARNAAAAAAGDWEVAVFVDADVILYDIAQVHAAVEVASTRQILTFAHNEWRSLPADATERVLAGGDPSGEPPVEANPNTFSSCYAVPRGLFDQLGGFDERFIGWGWEDLAFMWACGTFGNHFERVPGTVYHLWHDRPAGSQEDGPTYAANEALGRRYMAARWNRPAMAEVLKRPMTDSLH